MMMMKFEIDEFLLNLLSD